MTKNELIAELQRRGLELDISSCGCCGGASTKVKLDGVVVIDSAPFGDDDFGEFQFDFLPTPDN